MFVREKQIGPYRYVYLVESVREWPLGAPALLRFALYLLIPVGSWAGGAMVERAIDVLLD